MAHTAGQDRARSTGEQGCSNAQSTGVHDQTETTSLRNPPTRQRQM